MKRSVRGGICIFIMLFLGTLYAWSYFKVALEVVFPEWSQVQITLNFTILISCYSIGGFIAGNFMNKLSKTVQVRIASILLLIGFMGVSFLPAASGAIWKLYIFYGVLVGVGVGIAYNAVISAIPLWFLDKPGLISGLLLMGMGFGALLVGNAANWLIAASSLVVTFRILACVLFLVLFFGAPAVRVPSPVEMVPPEKIPSKKGVPAKSYAPGEMLRRPSFWLYFLWNILISSAGMLIVNSASSISVYFGMAAVIGLLVSIFNGVGRVILGESMDRAGWKKTLFLNNSFVIVGGLILCAGDSLALGGIVLLGMLLMGISYGGGAVLSMSMVRSLYGNEYFSQNASILNFSLIPASILGPMISAWLQDSFGGYTSTFVMVILLGLVSLGINLFIRRP